MSEPDFSNYPPVGFHFLVEFNLADTVTGDTKFQSVSGLSVDLDTEEVVEGGENRFKHKLPLRPRYQNVILKRGMLIKSDVIDWCRDAIENFEFKPAEVTIKLLDDQHQPLVSWQLYNAYPVKWNASEFNAEQSQLAIETLELAYNYFRTIK